MNLLEMADEEHRLVRDGIALHGDFFENATATTVAFSNLVGHPVSDCESFLRFHAKAKKHHTLAVLSAVRRHAAPGPPTNHLCVLSLPPQIEQSPALIALGLGARKKSVALPAAAPEPPPAPAKAAAKPRKPRAAKPC